MRVEIKFSDQFITEIAAAVVERLRPVILGLKAPAPGREDLMTVRGLAEYLGSSKDKVYRLTMTNTVPFVRVGRAVRFRRSDIDQWLAKRSVPDITSLSVPLAPEGRGIRNRVMEEGQSQKRTLTRSMK